MTGGRELGRQGRGGVEDGDMETAALTPAPSSRTQSSKHRSKCGIMLKLILVYILLSSHRFVGK